MSVSARLRGADSLDAFEVPRELEAKAPPEMRGLARDQVPLMVTTTDGISHRRFHDLPDVLRPGDLLVVNNSATLPAAVPVDDSLAVHFSTELPGGLWVVEIRRIEADGTSPKLDHEPGTLALPEGRSIELLTPYPVDSPTRRLWVGYMQPYAEVDDLLTAVGRPITYGHTGGPFPLEAYQTVFARVPGSAEMPSAGRPFTDSLVTSLVAAGVGLAVVTLHTGVSSLETGELPHPERYEVTSAAADAINATRGRGGRVVAVGTTVVRALETVADAAGRAHPGVGWTDLIIGPASPIRLVDGLITGWHEPNSTHLEMLRAIADVDQLVESYEKALQLGYLWHEFGDSHLLLPT